MTERITVFGGTGFIGRHLVALLLQSGATVRVPARRPGNVRITTQSANALEIIQADLLDEVTVGRVRGPLPAHLPRERVVVPAPCSCTCCGGMLVKLGEDVTETLEIVTEKTRQEEEVRFALDSSLEGDGFEPSVPRMAPGVVGCRCIDRHLDDTAARVSRFNGASLPSSPPRVDYWSSQTVDKS
jgi:NAD(P)-dependent dehydrogenase (short-subunit alcohol dehydrogenase family)